MRILVNRDFGGYGLSDEAEALVPAPIEPWDLRSDSAFRSHPAILAIFDELGSERFSGNFARVVAVEIPDGSFYVISEYDGVETVYHSASPIHFA